MNSTRQYFFGLTIAALLSFWVIGSTKAEEFDGPGKIPPDIQAIFNKPLYKDATWGLLVVDLKTGETLINLNPSRQFFIASVRKIFTVGELMNVIGPAHTYDTLVYRTGAVSQDGRLQGDLIVVASGDLTMGGRTKPDGTIEISNYDHNEGNDLGNAVLTEPNPLAGYKDLARQIAAYGIRAIGRDVIIDDRLFQPYEFRQQFQLRPIFVNDDCVDLIINPTEVGKLVSLKHRPMSAALAVQNDVFMRPAGVEIDIKPGLPECIGQPDCTAILHGDLPVGFTPPFTLKYPLTRTFRIVEPVNYARTVLIEQLQAVGVKVDAPTVEPNPVQQLPPKDSYKPKMLVAKLSGLPYSEDAKLVMKVSYNIGSDTSLLLYGVTQGVDNMEAALSTESKNLQTNYGIDPTEYHFTDGSGGGDTTAINRAVTEFLRRMGTRPSFHAYLDSFPILGVDGSLAFVTDFESDPSLKRAKGKVYAKTGTFVAGTEKGLILRGQSLGGYIFTKSGRKLVFQLVVNNVPLKGEDIGDVLQVFQDEGRISAILWRDN